MSIYPPAPKPPTALGRYRVLGPLAGVHVSPLQLGGTGIGDQQAGLFGEQDKESSFKLLDAYYEAGGNFIDTANTYRQESSEKFIGEWAEQRGIRDQLVIATKYASRWRDHDKSVKIQANYIGDNVKSMRVSVEASLKKLRTSYIDIFYVHWWDYETSIPEVMNGLHNLVTSGKVLYLGASDFPAWVVAKANQYADDHGKTPFVVYQGAWNVMSRDFEREIIPMARSLGLALAPFDVLGGGRFRSDTEEEQRRSTGEKGRMWSMTSGNVSMPGWERTEKEKAMARALEKVAKEVGVKHNTAVAIAYVMHKAPYVFPIIGGRKVEHLHANIEALNIKLSKEQIEFLESITTFDPGFPHSMLGDGTTIATFMGTTANFDKQPVLQPI